MRRWLPIQYLGDFVVFGLANRTSGIAGCAALKRSYSVTITSVWILIILSMM